MSSNVQNIGLAPTGMGVAPLSGNLGVAPSIERELELGRVFITSAFKNVPKGGTLDILLRIGRRQTAVRVAGSISVENKAVLNFFRDTKVRADGAALVLRKANTVSEETSSSLVFKDPRITDDGTGGESILIPAGNSGIIGMDKELIPVIVGPGQYLMRLTNTSGQAGDISIQLVLVEYKP